MNLKNSKEAILNHALYIFSRLGFNKTTMADIANASQRGRRTIYTYFKSKEEVFEAVVERELDKVLEIIKTKLSHIKRADEKLLVYIETRLTSIIKLTKYHEALHIAYMENYKRVEFMRQKLDQQEYQTVKDILTTGVNQGLFKIDNIEVVIGNLSILIRGIEFILIKEDKEELSDQHIKNMQHILLNGLLTSESQN